MAPTPSPTVGVGTRVLNACLEALGAKHGVSGHPESGCPFFVRPEPGEHHWPYNANNGPVSIDRSG
jgi:hypothetical protein